MASTQHAWTDPLEAALALESEPHLVLFYSGLSEHHTGRYSFLAWGLAEEHITSEWHSIAGILSDNKPWQENLWFGWLGYGMRCDAEKLSRGTPSPIDLPDTHLMRFNHLVRFDHETRRSTYHFRSASDTRWTDNHTNRHESPVATDLASQLTKADYLASIRRTKEHIEAGDFYQANITRKFTGRLANKLSYTSLFKSFCALSPSPYSAYIRAGDTHILSSSPECFLTIDPTGKMISRPIKGSAPRGCGRAEDEQIRARLLTSAKDHAENRMIVDLMRNDFSRVAIPASVEVTASSELTSYATVHHLISTVTATKQPNISTIDAVKACFPPGSMTGAPKIAAIEWCNEEEKLERGVYSGAIGLFGGDGSCDLSVVIRTLIVQEGRFEFQVGGGIVADSDPESEWMETLVKARGVTKLLNIEESALAAL